MAFNLIRSEACHCCGRLLSRCFWDALEAQWVDRHSPKFLPSCPQPFWAFQTLEDFIKIREQSSNHSIFFLISVPIADSAADDANSVSSLSTIRLSQFWAAGLTRSPRYSQQVSRNEKVTETYRNCIVQSYFKLLFTFLLTRVGVSCCHLHMTFVAPK